MNSSLDFIAEIPSVPPNVRVPLVQSSEQTFSVTWEEPENIERFDLEYFQISVFMSQPSITETGSVNATTTELGYHFILPLPAVTVEYIMVTAISKCSHELFVPAIWTNSKVIKSHQVTTTSHSHTVQDQRDQDPSDFINGINNNVIIAVNILYGGPEGHFEIVPKRLDWPIS